MWRRIKRYLLNKWLDGSEITIRTRIIRTHRNQDVYLRVSEIKTQDGIIFEPRDVKWEKGVVIE